MPKIYHYSALVENVDFAENEDLQFSDQLVVELGVTVVDKNLYQFKPQGRTIVYILSESHLAIHTWPEHKTIHVDLVTCSQMTQKEFELGLMSALADKKDLKIKITNCN